MRRLAWTLAVWFPWMAGAAEPVEVIRWDHIRHQLDYLPERILMDAELDAARASLTAAHALPNPEAELSLGRAQPFDEAEPDGTVWGVGLGMELPWPGILEGRISAAGSELDAAEAQRREIWRQTELQARALYLTLARDQHVAALWRHAVMQSEQLDQAVALRVDRGEDRPLEAFRAHTELERTSMDAQRSDAAWALHRASLARWLGAALPEEFLVEAELAIWGALPSKEEVAARARDGHPLLVAALAGTEVAEASLREAHGEVVPALSIGGFYETEPDFKVAGGSVGLEIPIGSPGAADVARARAEVTRAQQRQEMTSRQVDLEIDEAWLDYTTALMAAERYRDGIVPSAEAAANALTLAYDAGEVSLMDVLDARRVLLEVQLEEADALLDLQLAIATVTHLMGDPQ